MPWNKEPSGQQKEDARNARALQAKQNDLLAQQEREADQRRKKLNAQQINMLRSRFGVSGGGGGGNTSMAAGGGSPQGMSDSASSLFSRITGN